MRKRTFLGISGLCCLAFLTACFSPNDKNIRSAEQEAFETLSEEDSSAEAAEEELDLLPMEDYDATVYTIAQPDGVELTVQQIYLGRDKNDFPENVYAFYCTYRVAEKDTGKELQTISFWSSFESPLDHTEEPFADLNFDGYADITFTTYHAQNDNTGTYLWHPDTGSFEQFASFTGVAGTARNAAMKQISERMHGSASAGLGTMYQFVTPYELEKVWVVDYTYDRSDTETEGDAHFQLVRYLEGEREQFIDDIFLCDEDYANTSYYWKIYGAQIVHTIPIEGGTVYYAYYIKRPELDPEGVRHHYVFVVTDDYHLVAWAETENKKEVSATTLQETGGGAAQNKTPDTAEVAGGNAVVELIYGDGTSDLLRLQKTNELIE